MSRYKSVSNAFYLIGQPLIVNLIGLPAFAYVTHKLGPKGFGQVTAASAVVAIVGLWQGLGLRPLFVKRIAQHPEAAEEALSYQMGLRILLALGVGLLSQLVSFAWFGNQTVIQICVALSALALVITVVSGTLCDLLQGLQRLRAFATINFIAGIIVTACQVMAVWYGGGPIGFSAAFLAQPVTALIIAWYLLRRQAFPIRARFDLGRFRELLYDGRSIGGFQIAVGIRDRLESLLVPKMTGVASFGYFSAATMPINRLYIVPDGFMTAFYPAIAQEGKNNREEAAPTVIHLMVVSLVVCIPIAILLTFLAGPISLILFSKKQHPEICRDIMCLTAWMLPLRAFQLPMGSALQATGKHKEAANVGKYATLFSVLITILLIAGFGLMGASTAWVVRTGISAAFLLPLFLRHFPTVLPRVPFPRILGGALFMVALLVGFDHLHLHPLLKIVAGTAFGLLGYFGALILLRVISIAEVKQMLQQKMAARVDQTQRTADSVRGIAPQSSILPATPRQEETVLRAPHAVVPQSTEKNGKSHTNGPHPLYPLPYAWEKAEKKEAEILVKEPVPRDLSDRNIH